MLICQSSSAALALLFIIFQEVNGDDNNPITKRFKCRDACCDQHEWCRFWASAGECTANRGWMTDNCQLACKTCQKGVSRRSLRTNHRRLSTAVTRLPHGSTKKTKRKRLRKNKQKRPSRNRQHRPSNHPTTTSHLTQKTATTRRLTALDRCRQIQANPSKAAEILLRERLIFSAEDLSGRRPLTQEEVVRSNIAFACVPRLDNAECQRSLCYNLYYRTMDGTCNNFFQPLHGAAFRPYNRLLLPEYDNKLSEPVG